MKDLFVELGAFLFSLEGSLLRIWFVEDLLSQFLTSSFRL